MNRSDGVARLMLIAVSNGVVLGVDPRVLPWFGVDDEQVVKGAPLAFFLAPEAKSALERLLHGATGFHPPEAELLTFTARPDAPVVVASTRGTWQGTPATLLTVNPVAAPGEMLRSEAVLFDELTALSPLPVALVDARSGEVRRGNRHFRELWELPAGTLRGVSLRSLGLSHAVTRPTVAASSEDTTSLWLSPRAGPPRWFRVWARPLGQLEGVPWLLSLEDATWQAGHRDRPAHRGPSTSAVLETVLEAVMTLDADGTLLQLNREAERLLGVIPMRRLEERYATLRGRLLHPDGRPFEPEELPGIVAIRTGRAVRRVEMGIRRDDGGCRWVQVNANPFFADDDDVAGAVVTLSDITERKQAEEALRQVDVQRREFLAVLSHELRNPLAPLHTSLHLLRREGLPPEAARKAVEVMERQLNQLTHLVDDLLDATRIAAGKVQLRQVSLELNAAVADTVEDHRARATAKGVSLRIEGAERALFVLADPTRLAQALGNLLQNALRHTPAGGNILVTTSSEEGQASVGVSDDGDGIAPAELETLFTPFAQSPQGLARTQGGLGLGLAIVRGLVELHGGTVQLESEGLGRGTQVTLTLPLLAAHDPKEIPPTSRPSAPVAEGPPQRILLVEDNADAAQSLHAALSEQGHGVVTAMSAQEALDVTTTRAFDAVFCDIGLPDLDGYALAGALRERLGSSAALFALTGYAAPEDVARARAAGFDQHLTKPPRLPELCALLAAYARRRTE